MTEWKARAERAHTSAQRFIDSHFGSVGEKPRISIPAEPGRDDDLVLSGYITDSADEIDRLRAALSSIAEGYDHEHHSLGAVPAGQCDGAPWCRVCEATKALGDSNG